MKVSLFLISIFILPLISQNVIARQMAREELLRFTIDKLVEVDKLQLSNELHCSDDFEAVTKRYEPTIKEISKTYLSDVLTYLVFGEKKVPSDEILTFESFHNVLLKKKAIIASNTKLGEFKCGLTTLELLALHFYKAGEHLDINGALRFGSKVNAFTKNTAKLMQIALKKIGLYRGFLSRRMKPFSKDVRLAQIFRENSVFHEKAFLSSSAAYCESCSTFFGPTRILVKTNKRCHAIWPLLHVSEQEVICESGTKFKVHLNYVNLEPVRGLNENKEYNEVHYLYLEELDDPSYANQALPYE